MCHAPAYTQLTLSPVPHPNSFHKNKDEATTLQQEM
jgi:hypothetical protein